MYICSHRALFKFSLLFHSVFFVVKAECVPHHILIRIARSECKEPTAGDNPLASTFAVVHNTLRGRRYDTEENDQSHGSYRDSLAAHVGENVLLHCIFIHALSFFKGLETK